MCACQGNSSELMTDGDDSLDQGDGTGGWKAGEWRYFLPRAGTLCSWAAHLGLRIGQRQDAGLQRGTSTYGDST